MTNRKRQELLARMESIVGNSFYNKATQNWEPNGLFLGEGRHIRYPISFDTNKGDTVKKRRHSIDPKDQDINFLTGRYTVGVNELNIVQALDQIVTMFEREYGIKIGEKPKQDCPHCGKTTGDLDMHISQKHPDQWQQYSSDPNVMARLSNKVCCDGCGSFLKTLEGHDEKCLKTLI